MDMAGLWLQVAAFLRRPFGEPIYYLLPAAAILWLLLDYLFRRLRRCYGTAEKARYWKSCAGVSVGLLVVLATLSVGNYLDQFGKWRYGSYFNSYEFYHYYLGSKYHKELSYDHLYAATLIADKDTGLKYSNTGKNIRELSTGSRVLVENIFAEEDRYRALFSEERWAEFCKDVKWFKRKLATKRWNRILQDKGYNATPVWSMVVGTLFSNRISTQNIWGMYFLASLDLVLICAAVAMVFWAYGPRAALLFLLLLGATYTMKFSHLKGAYLRTDFAVALVMAVCLLKKERYALAGVALAWSVLSRVFPVVFLFGLAAKIVWSVLALMPTLFQRLRSRLNTRWAAGLLLSIPHGIAIPLLFFSYRQIHAGAGPTQTLTACLLIAVAVEGLFFLAMGIWAIRNEALDRRYLRFFLAFSLTVILLVGASVGYGGGLSLWKDYSAKITRHNQDISPWRVGFKYVFMAQFSEQSTPVKGRRFSEIPILKTYANQHIYMRGTIYKDHPFLWYSIILGMLFCVFLAMRHLPDHQALALSFVPCFFMVAPTYYYYIMLLAVLLFFAAEQDRFSRIVGMIWMFFLGGAGYYFYAKLNLKQTFATYYWCSLMLLVLVAYMTVLALGQGRGWFRSLVLMLLTAGLAAFIWQCWPNRDIYQHWNAWWPWVLPGYMLLCVVTEVMPGWKARLTPAASPAKPTLEQIGS